MISKKRKIQDPRNATEKTWIRVTFHVEKDEYSTRFYFKIFDFKWNFVAILTQWSVNFYAPKSVLDNASGLLMEGCDKWSSMQN